MRDANELEDCSANVFNAIVDMEPYSSETIQYSKFFFCMESGWFELKKKIKNQI